MTRFRALLLAASLVLLSSCGSDDSQAAESVNDDATVSEDTAAQGAAEPADAVPSDQDDTSDDDAATDSADEVDTGVQVECSVDTSDPADESVTLSFTSSESATSDYYIRVAEPDGSNDSLIKVDAVPNGEVVAQSFSIVGPPEDCAVVDVEIVAATIDGAEDVSCEMTPDAASGADAAVTITNSGTDTARYDLVMAFFDGSGTRIRQQISGAVDLTPGDSITRDVLTPIDFGPEDTCKVAASRRR